LADASLLPSSLERWQTDCSTVSASTSNGQCCQPFAALGQSAEDHFLALCGQLSSLKAVWRIMP
jgi:hypothetical protein